jgi:hypothetical protein
MKAISRLAFVGAALFLTYAAIAPLRGQQLESRSSVSIRASRPLAEALATVELNCKCAVTYEDPLQTISTPPEVFSFSYPDPFGATDVADFVERLIAKYNDDHFPGLFKVKRDGPLFHVVPAAGSVLDVLIDPVAGSTVAEMIAAILIDVRAKTGIWIRRGMDSLGDLTTMKAAAIQGGTAQEALSRLLSTGGLVSWKLSSESGAYSLAIHRVAVPSPPVLPTYVVSPQAPGKSTPGARPRWNRSAPPIHLPDETGTFPPQSALIIMEISNRCSGGRPATLGPPNLLVPWTAELDVNGVVQHRRVTGHIRLGFSGNRVRAELGRRPQRPSAVFVSDGTSPPTLLLRNRNRVIVGASFPDVLQHVTGVGMDSHSVAEIILGCHSFQPLGYPVTYGDLWRRITGGRNGSVYLHRTTASDPWRVVSMLFPGEGLHWLWRLDYSDFDGLNARSFHLMSSEAGRYDLTFRLQELGMFQSLPADVFALDLPESAKRMTLEQLRPSDLFEIDALPRR